MMRFDRFTERALDAATRSYEILQRYSHNQVDTEHMLLALLEQPEGVIPQILEKLGVNIETVKGRLDGVLSFEAANTLLNVLKEAESTPHA